MDISDLVERKGPEDKGKNGKIAHTEKRRAATNENEFYISEVLINRFCIQTGSNKLR